jgi:hypothetical protein
MLVISLTWGDGPGVGRSDTWIGDGVTTRETGLRCGAAEAETIVPVMRRRATVNAIKLRLSMETIHWLRIEKGARATDGRLVIY